MKTKELLNVVTAALSGIKSNSKDGQNILFKNGYLYTWSAAIAVSAKLPDGAEDLTGIINGEDLAKFLSKLNKNEIEIQCEDVEWCITSDMMTARLVARTDNALADRITKVTNENLVWHKLPNNFYQSLAICDIPNNTKKTSGIFMKKNLMVSTDNIRVNKATLSSDIDGSVWMSQFSVAEIRRLKQTFTEYALSSRWIHFRNVEKDSDVQLEFACNRLDDSVYKYQTFAGFLDKANEVKFAEGVLPDLTEALNMASCFDNYVEFSDSSVLSNIVSLTFDKTMVTVSSERAKSGNYSEKLAYPDGNNLDIDQPFKVKVTALFLLEACKHSNKFGLATVGKNTVILFNGKDYSSAVMVLV